MSAAMMVRPLTRTRSYAVSTRTLTTSASRTCDLVITQVSTFAVNYKGKPYMEGLAANKGLLITLGAIGIVRWDGGEAGGGKIRVRDRAMPLTPHPPTPQPGPSPWVGGSALAIAGLTSGNLSGLSEYLELVPLPTEALRSDLMGLMAADFCLCWTLDKLLTKAFAY